jgi:Icc-related predicted phosphoesterase
MEHHDILKVQRINNLKICVISDVHAKWSKLVIPKVDVLISAGDYSFTGETHLIKDFHEWLDEQDAHHTISVQGNHEKWVEKNFQLAKEIAEKACPGVHFMDEGLVEIEGVKIWCSAISKFFCNWAWNRYPGEELQKHWDRIPKDADIVVTHGPCYGILDGVMKFNGQKCEYELEHCGDQQLLDKILEVKPKYHIAGHIHEGRGIYTQDGITFINASICDDNYKAVNEPIIITI